MNTLWLALGGAWNVLWVGLLLGAGLPAIFALGIRALSYGVGGDAASLGVDLTGTTTKSEKLAAIDAADTQES